MNTTHAIQRLREVIRRQHKAISTESNYAYWLRHYTAALRQMPETLSSREKLQRFLTGLACQSDVAASTQNQAFNAIVFFYKEVLDQPIEDVDALRAKRPVHMRHAPTMSETVALLQTVRDVGGYPTNLIARLLRLRIARRGTTQFTYQGCQSGAWQSLYPGSQRRKGQGCVFALVAGPRIDPANAICTGSLATGQAKRHPVNAAGATGKEIPRIPIRMAVGVAFPLALSLPIPEDWRRRSLSDARSQCATSHQTRPAQTRYLGFASRASSWLRNSLPGTGGQSSRHSAGDGAQVTGNHHGLSAR
jgi:hypothetical protein